VFAKGCGFTALSDWRWPQRLRKRLSSCQMGTSVEGMGMGMGLELALGLGLPSNMGMSMAIEGDWLRKVLSRADMLN